RADHAAAAPNSSMVIVAGGDVSAESPLSSTELFPLSSSGAACTTNCECSAGLCVNDSCCTASLPIGAQCQNKCECTSGACVDGVCCDQACDGACQGCSAAAKGGGQDGACDEVHNRADPRHKCTAQSSTSCGRTGFC